jgi:hypothetical protein
VIAKDPQRGVYRIFPVDNPETTKQAVADVRAKEWTDVWTGSLHGHPETLSAEEHDKLLAALANGSEGPPPEELETGKQPPAEEPELVSA